MTTPSRFVAWCICFLFVGFAVFEVIVLNMSDNHETPNVRAFLTLKIISNVCIAAFFAINQERPINTSLEEYEKSFLWKCVVLAPAYGISSWAFWLHFGNTGPYTDVILAEFIFAICLYAPIGIGVGLFLIGTVCCLVIFFGRLLMKAIWAAKSKVVPTIVILPVIYPNNMIECIV